MLIWVPVYWIHNGPANFLWLCDVANFAIALAIWLESPLLFSAQAVSVLAIQFAWMVDFFGRLLTGVHLLGATDYMFDTATPWWLRGLSLFHIFVPALLLWAIWKLGYDSRGWRLQTLFAWLVLPASFVAGDPEQNLNWLWAPFGVPQTLLTPISFMLVCMVLYPLLLYLPSHALLLWWARRSGLVIRP